MHGLVYTNCCTTANVIKAFSQVLIWQRWEGYDWWTSDNEYSISYSSAPEDRVQEEEETKTEGNAYLWWYTYPAGLEEKDLLILHPWDTHSESMALQNNIMTYCTTEAKVHWLWKYSMHSVCKTVEKNIIYLQYKSKLMGNIRW